MCQYKGQEVAVNALLNPKDKMNVTAMFNLLSAIATLSSALETDSPTDQQAQRVLRFIGGLYTHMLEAYTNVHLSLHQQLVHLSATAHWTLAFYEKEKGRGMPSQLYFDTMSMIKNAYFCVAKTQLDNPDGQFWIILLGTNALEKLFGRLRTMSGSDHNFDLFKVARKADAAVTCEQIFAKQPELDSGSERLELPAWQDTAGNISKKADHINPRSWIGNVYIKGVDTKTYWIKGRWMAERELSAAGWEAPFNAMEIEGQTNIYCPFGKNIKVLLDAPSEGDFNEEDFEDEEAENDTQHRLGSAVDDGNNPNLEEQAHEELIQRDAGAAKHDIYVFVDNDNKIAQHKLSVLKILSDPFTPDSDLQDQLKRVHGYSCCDLGIRKPELDLEPTNPDEPVVTICDPIALLVCSKDCVWLAVAQISSIATSNSPAIQSIPYTKLQHPNTRLKVQIM